MGDWGLEEQWINAINEGAVVRWLRRRWLHSWPHRRWLQQRLHSGLQLKGKVEEEEFSVQNVYDWAGPQCEYLVEPFSTDKDAFFRFEPFSELPATPLSRFLTPRVFQDQSWWVGICFLHFDGRRFCSTHALLEAGVGEWVKFPNPLHSITAITALPPNHFG